MAPQLGNFVLETATAPGTGSFTLNGPETSRRSFSAAFPNGGSVFYFADDGSSAEWGVGTLTIGTPSTLSRTTIIGTTSGGTSALNFSGSVEVYNEIPAEYLPILEKDGSLVLRGNLTVPGFITAGYGSGMLGGTANGAFRWTRPIQFGNPFGTSSFLGGFQIGDIIGDPNNDQSGINMLGYDYQNTRYNWYFSWRGQITTPYGAVAFKKDVSASISSAQSALQGNIDGKVNKGGDTMSGGLTINASAGITTNGGYHTSYGTWNGNLGTAGNNPWAGQFISKYNESYSGASIFCHRTLVGSYEYASIQVMGADGKWHELQFRSSDNRLYTANGYVFALTSEIPTDIYSGTSFNNDFGGSYWNGAAVIHLPFGLKQVSFYVANVSDGQRINYIEGFSANPSSISIQPKTGNTVAHRETISNEDAGGFTIHIYGSYDGIWVTAIGPK